MSFGWDDPETAIVVRFPALLLSSTIVTMRSQTLPPIDVFLICEKDNEQLRCNYKCRHENLNKQVHS